MYKGEVKIYQENLDRFLAIAQRFQLQGLLMKEGDSTKEIDHCEKKDPPAQQGLPTKDLSLPEKITHPVGSFENLKDINLKL